MSFRFRLGPFTIGRTGLRYSSWGKRGGISTPIFGSSKQTFGIVRAGPVRWHFSKKLGTKGGRHSDGKHRIPMRDNLYKCPQCNRYSARKVNWIGRLRLKCASCRTLSIYRGIKNVGTLLRPNRMLYFQTIKPTTAAPRPEAYFRPSMLGRIVSLVGLIVRVVFGLVLLLIILMLLLALVANC